MASFGVFQSVNHNINYPYKYSKEFKNSVLESFKNVKSPKYISISKNDNEMKFCEKGSKSRDLDFSNTCYVFNRTNAFLSQIDDISTGIDITFDSNFIYQIDEFKQKIKAEKVTHIFTSKNIFLDITHKELIVDSITRQRVYIL